MLELMVGRVKIIDGSCMILATWVFFFFNDTATTEIYTLSLHDALPICGDERLFVHPRRRHPHEAHQRRLRRRSEEHTSELQSLTNIVCRLLLEKKKEKGCCRSISTLNQRNTRSHGICPNLCSS